MIKEVELKKLNGVTQYVDWETGEELFKKSDCISIKEIKDTIKELEKELSKDEAMLASEFEHKFLAVEFYNKLLKGI